MIIKDKTITIRGVSPEIVYAMNQVDLIGIPYDYMPTMTSCVDGKHSHTSLHYGGNAFDIRTRDMDLDNIDIEQFAEDLRQRLPAKDFDVIVESNHIHVEYQPKKML